MRYTLILEFPDGRTENISFNILLNLFHFIKSRFSQIKKYKQTLTIIHGDKYLYKPNETNILIQNVKDYFKYIDNKISKIDYFSLKKNEVVVFNTGNSNWVDTNILEAIKRPCDKTTKVIVVKKKELIEISKQHTKKGVYKL
jgi:hypothetical protein